MNEYFPKMCKLFWGNVKVELDLSNYATKADWKGATVADASNLTAKSDLASLRAKVDKVDISKLVTVPGGLGKLNNVADKDVEKGVYDKLVSKVNTIDNSGLVLKTQYNSDKLGLEKKILVYMMQKYQKLRVNTSLCLIIINLRLKCLMQR